MISGQDEIIQMKKRTETGTKTVENGRYERNGKNAETMKNGRLLIVKRDDKILTLLYGDNNRLLRADASDCETTFLNNIYIGKIKNVSLQINAAFAEFTPGILCFLPLKDCKRPILTNRAYDGRLLAGDEIVLQIVSEKQKAKEACASGNLSFTGKYLVLTSGRRRIGYSPRLSEEQKKEIRAYIQNSSVFTETEQTYGIIFRTNVKELTEYSVLKQELSMLRREAEGVLEKAPHRTCFSLLKQSLASYLKNLQDYDTSCYEKIVTDDPSIYEEAKAYLERYQPSDLKKLVFYEDPLLPLSRLYSVEARLSEALDRKVWLKSGGYLVIDKTEALTCIDVNSGKYTGKKRGSAEETYFHINMEAAQEIGHQLLLRNISGIIIIDFINMEAERQNQMLLESLRRILEKDPLRTTVVDMTPLGLVEVTRKKGKKSLWEQLHTSTQTGEHI